MSVHNANTPKTRRSERLKGRKINVNNISCKICELPDTIEMVQCDDCNAWYHFLCANVTAAIEDEDWSCLNCQRKRAKENTPAGSIHSKKTSSKNRLDIEMEILEEARALEKKRDEEYLEKKKLLLVEGSQRGTNSVKSANRVVEKWVQMEQGVQINQHRNVYATNAIQTTSFNYHLGARAHSSHNKQPLPVPATTSLPNPPRPESVLYNQRIPLHELSQPNSIQMANRHSMSRDLPNFHGSPEEWPLFVSTFERSTRLCGFSDEENLMRLQKCLKGRVLEAMRGRLMLPSNVPNIMHTLRIMYGRPKIIIKSLLQKIQAETKINIEKVETVVSYSLAVQNLISTMEACELYPYLENAELLDDLVSKLPTQLMLNWAASIEDMPSVNLLDFNAWLYRLIDNICRVSPGISFDQDVKTQTRRKEKAHINAHAEENETKQLSNKQRCTVCNQACNGIEFCKRFQNMSINEKWQVIKQNRICRTCLTSHLKSPCKVNSLCGVNGCVYRHHRLLHKDSTTTTFATPMQNADSNHHPAIQKIQQNCNAHGSTDDIKYRVVPIILYNNEKKIATYAFLDDGSSLTMMEDSLADELNLKGKQQPLFLKWTGNTHRKENQSRIVSVDVSGRENPKKKFLIPLIRTVKSLNLPQQSLDVKQLTERYPYLQGYPIQSYEKAVPRILIGLDNLKLAIPLKVVEGGEGNPVATKTRLGWIAYGPSSINVNKPGESVFDINFHECECANAKHSDYDDTLQNMMKSYFSLDSLGVVEPKKWVKSQDEERACEMLEALTTKNGCHYDTGLLWKYDNVKLPNSFQMALRRHNCFVKKLSRNPDLANKIKKQLKDYEAKNYIRKLSVEELQTRFPRTWYLPIFVVTNENKPGKHRIVWDAAAEVNGTSLNSVLLKGPDQLVSLISVLYRFQERPIAVCADIREMFHQVGVRSEDQHAQRFLWNDDLDSTPDVYVMQVLTFGATCSPSSAQFVKNKNAQEFSQYPRAVDSILHSHYVDDLLDSVDTVDEAIKLAEEVKLIHRNGGFEIRNWISNSSHVIEALGEQRPEEKRSLDINPETQLTKLLPISDIKESLVLLTPQ